MPFPRPNGPRLNRSLLLALCCGVGTVVACSDDDSSPTQPVPGTEDLAQGKQTFRFDTFGDETFWTDTLRMHEVIQAGVSPQTALAVGLKVDADALPPGILESADLTDPATTVALLKLNAVVGLKGTVETINGKDTLTAVGITCALCHSTVNNSVASGIGSRLDGWPNLDLDPGAIIALSPSLTAEQKAVYQSWGPGKYDARYNFDGKNDPSLIPPAYGLSGVHSVTYTGDGDRIAYWNRYVAVTQMHGHGSFTEPRLGIEVSNPPDMVESKLAALEAYQLSIESPVPPAGSFDAAAATRGEAVFAGAGRCAECHTGSELTDANTRLHQPSEIPTDPTHAERSATKMYRTTPLRGLWQHAPYFHDGSAATLADVVQRYEQAFGLGLTEAQKADLIEYLKSL
ncbi:MAG TPA: c-type cytochrome [Gemmatimonadales bacterium]|nr:c-type cytochrome [Gemmatimonadales bacterium]